MSEITIDDFLKVEMRVGTIIEATDNKKARVPSYVLKIDFGSQIGIKTSSAQITQRYTKEELLGKQVICVMNFPPKRVAGIKSEVLVLAAMDQEKGTTLLAPNLEVTNGLTIA